MVGCQNPVWSLWKGNKYFAVTGNRTKVLRTYCPFFSFNISLLLRLIVVEGAEPMTYVYIGPPAAMKFHRIRYG